MNHVSIPVLYNEGFRNQMVKPEVQNNVLELIAKKFNQDPAYMNTPTSEFGAIKFGCAVFLPYLTNSARHIDNKNLKADDPISLHDGAVEIRFLYVEQSTPQKLPDGSLIMEQAVLELLEPMVFRVNNSRNGLVLKYTYNHMVVVPGVEGVPGSEKAQIQQQIEFEGTVQDGKIIVTFNKKPYGINPLGYFAKVHRTVK